MVRLVLGDDIRAFLPEIRGHAVSLLHDRVRVERRLGRRVMDPVTLEYVESWQVVYEGPGRVRINDVQPSEEAEAGRTFVVTDATVQLPVDDTAYAEGDRVTFLACEHDPSLTGGVFTVNGRDPVTQATLRRLRVSEVTAK